MFTEKLGMSEYTRFEQEDIDEIQGKRIKGHGKIEGWTNAEGEQHPAFVETEDGKMWTPEDLAIEAEFDARHDIIDFDLMD